MIWSISLFVALHVSLFPFLKSVKSSCVTVTFELPAVWIGPLSKFVPGGCFKCVIPSPEGNNSSCECHIDDVLCLGVFTVRSAATVKHKEKKK